MKKENKEQLDNVENLLLGSIGPNGFVPGVYAEVFGDNPDKPSRIVALEEKVRRLEKRLNETTPDQNPSDDSSSDLKLDLDYGADEVVVDGVPMVPKARVSEIVERTLSHLVGYNEYGECQTGPGAVSYLRSLPEAEDVPVGKSNDYNQKNLPDIKRDQVWPSDWADGATFWKFEDSWWVVDSEKSGLPSVGDVVGYPDGKVELAEDVSRYVKITRAPYAVLRKSEIYQAPFDEEYIESGIVEDPSYGRRFLRDGKIEYSSLMNWKGEYPILINVEQAEKVIKHRKRRVRS